MLKSGLLTIFALVSVIGVSCSDNSGAAAGGQEQVSAVQRGSIAVEITSSGNLALSHKEDMAFQMAGFVEQVAVKEGESIKQGQVLANLNTSDDWEAQVTTLDRQLTAAQRKVTTAERNKVNAERKVTTAERSLADTKKQVETQIAAKEQALLQAQINLKTAETALSNSQDVNHWPEADAVIADIKAAESNLRSAKEYQQTAYPFGDPAGWGKLIEREMSKIVVLNAKLDAILTGADPNEVLIKKKQLTIAQANLKDAQDGIPKAAEDGKISIENAQRAVDDAKTGVDDADSAIDDANTAVADAQKALDKVKNASPEVKAPFAGFVTLVNVNGGDEVKKGTIAMQIADPTKFEAAIIVSEKDFARLKLGADATVQINALSGITLPAKVTYIAPTATVQQGVANYKVRVELQSLTPVTRAIPVVTARPQVTTTPSAKPQATSTSTPTPRSTPAGQGQTQGQGAQSSSNRTGAFAAPQAVQLSEGMSVTVSIVIDQRADALLVPNQAIIVQNGQNMVRVKTDAGIENRPIQTGLSNWQSTEIVSGLAEGEQIVYTRAAVSSGTSTTPGATAKPQQQPFMPSSGGFGR